MILGTITVKYRYFEVFYAEYGPVWGCGRAESGPKVPKNGQKWPKNGQKMVKNGQKLKIFDFSKLLIYDDFGYFYGNIRSF